MSIDSQGRLLLGRLGETMSYVGNASDTLMWIALRQCDGDRDAAARTLADAWEVDQANARADLELWVGEMCALGLLEDEDHDCGIPTAEYPGDAGTA
ncbi:PqqD family protein [Streptomyces sp. NPDC019531]|uniref:PqqD family protein n=1 Tax=Streptomyces sp. NPDC019531 TaxID=3365062 RepID=UPI00384E1616